MPDFDELRSDLIHIGAQHNRSLLQHHNELRDVLLAQGRQLTELRLAVTALQRDLAILTDMLLALHQAVTGGPIPSLLQRASVKKRARDVARRLATQD